MKRKTKIVNEKERKTDTPDTSCTYFFHFVNFLLPPFF